MASTNTPTNKTTKLNEFFNQTKIKLAFIVGNTYTNSEGLNDGLNDSKFHLKKVSHDVLKMEEILKKCGFECKVVNNSRNLQNDFKNYLKSLTQFSHVEFVFFFSGHGLNFNGELYLCNNNNIETGVPLSNLVREFEEKECKIRDDQIKELEKLFEIEQKMEKNTLLNERIQVVDSEIKKSIQLIDELYNQIESISENNKINQPSFSQMIQQGKKVNEIKLKILSIENNIENIKKGQRYKSMFLDIEYKKIFILDCCRSDLNLANFIKSAKFEFKDRPDTAFLYACSPGEVAMVLNKDNLSLLTKSLTERIENDFKFAEIMEREFKNDDKIPKFKGRNLCDIAKVVQTDIIEQLCNYTFDKKEIVIQVANQIPTVQFDEKKIEKISDPDESSIKNNSNTVTIKNSVRQLKEIIGQECTPEKFSIILKKKINLLHGDITIGDFIFCDIDFLKKKENMLQEVD